MRCDSCGGSYDPYSFENKNSETKAKANNTTKKKNSKKQKEADFISADFINKLEIALKESFETEYWLELLHRKNKIDESTYKGLINKCGTIRRKLIASVTTAKNKR